MFVIPDWSTVISLLPILIFLGVVGPLITFTMLGILVYQARKPRVSVKIVEGPAGRRARRRRRAGLPAGPPFCRRDRLIYPTGHDPCDTLPRGAGRHLPDVRAWAAPRASIPARTADSS